MAKKKPPVGTLNEDAMADLTQFLNDLGTAVFDVNEGYNYIAAQYDSLYAAYYGSSNGGYYTALAAEKTQALADVVSDGTTAAADLFQPWGKSHEKRRVKKISSRQ